MADEIFDVVVIGGGPIGLAAAYEVAKKSKKVIVLEQNKFHHHAGSSGDLARMYTEDFMADLAKDALYLWDSFEADAKTPLRWMSGLLNFGDKHFGEDTPEGTLLGPIENLKRLGMRYEELTAQEIEQQYPFKNLDPDWVGIYAPDNGVIDVQRLLRTLLRMAKDWGATTKQHTRVTAIKPIFNGRHDWDVHAIHNGSEPVVYKTKKVIIASGAYVNHVLEPSFDITLDLDIWEMVSSYYHCNANPEEKNFPSMWFQFAPSKNGRSQLFYGFPPLPWGPDNLARIAVDAATQRVKDPADRKANVIDPQDLADTQAFVRETVANADPTVPAFASTCLQTNVFDNMFVLDFIPEKYLGGGPKNSVAIFTAGWAMKFVPTIGKALAQLVLEGESPYALKQFAIDRNDPKTGLGIIQERAYPAGKARTSAFTFDGQASGSSLRGIHNVGL